MKTNKENVSKASLGPNIFSLFYFLLIALEEILLFTHFLSISGSLGYNYEEGSSPMTWQWQCNDGDVQNAIRKGT